MKAPVLLLLILTGSGVNAQDPISNLERTIVFQDVHVIPMDRPDILEHQDVMVTNGIITLIATANTAQYPTNATIINGKGKYLMPGLAEMHAHVPPVDDVEPMKDVMMLFLVNGITTIRGMLGHPRHLELRDKLRSGEVMGPNFYTTGPSFNGNSVSSPGQAADMVRAQKKDGYDFLKLHPGLQRIEFDSIAAASKKAGIPFVGHVSFDVGVRRACEAEYSSIDHLDGFVESLVPGIDAMTEQQTGLFGMFIADQALESKIPALMEQLKANNISVVPTQSLAEKWFNPDYSPENFRNDPHAAYMTSAVIEQWISTKKNLMANPNYDPMKMKKFIELRRKLIKACHDNGVRLLLGCDAPQVFNVPGFSTHHELEYLVRSGLTPYQALQTGTVNVAAYLGLKNTGVLREGAMADMILLSGNPLADIRQTMNVSGVMIGKNYLTKEYIETALKKLTVKK